MEICPILDNRLKTISEFVRDGSTVADIGTDHAYLIAYLAATGKIKKGFACDINELPLSKAKITIKKYSLEEKIDCVLTDGLIGLNLDEIDDIIVAGMGGDTIVDILTAEKYNFTGKRFILQPMTKCERLREGLCSLGIKILEENPVTSGRFTYTLLICEYTGETIACDEIYKYLGEIVKSKSENRNRYLKRVYNNISKRLDGLIKTTGHEDEIKNYNAILEKIKDCVGGNKLESKRNPKSNW